MGMTWNEFKASVDATIKDGGFDGDHEIQWIDIGMTNKEDLEVAFHTGDKTMIISSS